MQEQENTSVWSVQRVEQFAPDAAAIKAAHSLAQPGKWSNLGRVGQVIWGECQGSGASPYQVRIDLVDAAYKCGCPSRKLPCKHTLGLLLMLASGAAIPTASAPEFVKEWTGYREKRAQTRAAKPAPSEKPPDAQAQTKRIEKRESRIEGGMEQLEIWLADIVSQGLAATRAQPPAFWTQMVARLVDAQAPGLARKVRELSDAAVAANDWQTQLLAGLARLQLLVDAYRNLETLPADLGAEVRTLVGWTQPQETLLEREGVRDLWHVAARRQSQQETLRTQTTWLVGRSSPRIARVLEFAVGNQPLPVSFAIGQVIDAELVFFDGVPPSRALVKNRFGGTGPSTTLPAPCDIATLQTRFASALALNPWLERLAVVLGPVNVSLDRDQAVIGDEAGRRIQLVRHFRHTWHLVSLCRSGPVVLFGEWNGHAFDAMSVEHAGALFSVAQSGGLAVLSRVA